jgi:hypothetical protein
MTLLPAAPNAPQATDDKTSWLGDVGIAQGVPKKNDFDNGIRWENIFLV